MSSSALREISGLCGAGKGEATSAGTTRTAERVTIPLHGGQEIGPPLFHKILRQLGVSLEEFEQLR